MIIRYFQHHYTHQSWRFSGVKRVPWWLSTCAWKTKVPVRVASVHEKKSKQKEKDGKIYWQTSWQAGRPEDRRKDKPRRNYRFKHKKPLLYGDKLLLLRVVDLEKYELFYKTNCRSFKQAHTCTDGV